MDNAARRQRFYRRLEWQWAESVRWRPTVPGRCIKCSSRNIPDLHIRTCPSERALFFVIFLRALISNSNAGSNQHVRRRRQAHKKKQNNEAASASVNHPNTRSNFRLQLVAALALETFFSHHGVCGQRAEPVAVSGISRRRVPDLPRSDASADTSRKGTSNILVLWQLHVS